MFSKGKDIREKEIAKFRHHLSTVYQPLERKWLILFPEGGFLYKRLELSQRYVYDRTIFTCWWL